MAKLIVTQLLEAIEHLYEALRILKSVLEEIERGAMRGTEISKSLATAWFQVNCCRLYTESDLDFEELNLAAMRLIDDAKSMIDSLISWESRSARLSLSDTYAPGGSGGGSSPRHVETAPITFGSGDRWTASSRWSRT